MMTTWMGPEGIVLNEINQTKKGKYCMVTYKWNLKKKKKKSSSW